MRDITSLIIQQLEKAHDGKIEVYREEQEGGFSEPSFFVQRLSLGITPRPFDQQDRLYRFHIVYFPEPERPKEDMDLMAEWLAENMQVLDTVGALTERELQVLEGEKELHYSFVVNFVARAEETEVFLENLTAEGGLKRES
ncbi:phage tail terminator family protein [Enterococcus olivae]